jgi:adenylate kinase
MRMILMGLAGSGKGTLAKDVVERMGREKKTAIPHLSTGDIFRAILKRDDDLARDLKQYVTTGALVPDEVTCRVVEDRLGQSDCAPGFLLAQAEWLQKHLEAGGQAIDAALSLKVDPEVCTKRLLGRIQCSQCGQGFNTFFSPPKKEGACDACGAPLKKRPDDAEQVIRKRIAEDADRVSVLEAFYGERGVLKQVKAEGTPAEVADRAWNEVAGA